MLDRPVIILIYNIDFSLKWLLEPDARTMQKEYMQLKKLSTNIQSYYNKVTQTSYAAKDWSKDKKK